MKWFALLLLLGLGAGEADADDFDAWILSRGRIETRGGPTEARLPVGSLQKPFLIRAWAETHSAERTPTFTCTRTSGCWRPSGHGALDLRGALRVSCNTYFATLARQASREAVARRLREAGFEWNGDLTEEEAIGLPGVARPTVAPERLLASYADLVRTPWTEREDIRQELLSGLRDSAEEGTAQGLGLWGYLAKTGTVPALDGAPLKTSGLALVLADDGFALLGLLRRGTGREAAIRVGEVLKRLRPGAPSRASRANERAAAVVRPAAQSRGLLDPVRVEMLGELGLKELRLKNLGEAPADSSHGFVGPGGSVSVNRGDHFGEGPWEIQGSPMAFLRRVRAAIDVPDAPGPLRLLATMAVRDYANGILKAELGTGRGDLRSSLAAAVLRFLGRPRRHEGGQVCDSTHCAWFVGEGPVPRWIRSDRAVLEREVAKNLSDAEWSQAIQAARAQPGGPDAWTADCGGDPLSPHFIWGGGDRRVLACSRHKRGAGKNWRRIWSSADLNAVFGGTPSAIDVVATNGQWRLQVRLETPRTAKDAGTLALSYDDAHRRLASRMGWDAMPSPAARVSRTATGYVAEGVGFGHRVGLCLAE